MYFEGIRRIKLSVNEATLFISRLYNHIKKQVTPRRRYADSSEISSIMNGFTYPSLQTQSYLPLQFSYSFRKFHNYVNRIQPARYSFEPRNLLP